MDASKLLAEMNQQELNSHVLERGNLFNQTMLGREVFTEVGIVTETELKDIANRVVGVRIEKLQAVGSSGLTDHLGEVANSFYVISLRGLPCDEIHSM